LLFALTWLFALSTTYLVRWNENGNVFDGTIMKRKRLRVSSVLEMPIPETFSAVPSSVRQFGNIPPSKLSVVSGFASPDLCTRLIRLCEKVGFKKEADVTYRQSTVDLEVDASPRIKKCLKAANLIDALQKHMLTVFEQQVCAFDDLFVVKYDAAEQRELERHYDAGDISFMLALSKTSSYVGGGTRFDGVEDHALQLEQGELVLFDASMYHAGIPITHGRHPPPPFHHLYRHLYIRLWFIPHHKDCAICWLGFVTQVLLRHERLAICL
jgi:hypothetical protein